MFLSLLAGLMAVETPCFFITLSDIYDAVIAKTTTSGDRKIGGLLQSANQRPRKMSEL